MAIDAGGLQCVKMGERCIHHTYVHSHSTNTTYTHTAPVLRTLTQHQYYVHSHSTNTTYTHTAPVLRTADKVERQQYLKSCEKSLLAGQIRKVSQRLDDSSEHLGLVRE